MRYRAFLSIIVATWTLAYSSAHAQQAEQSSVAANVQNVSVAKGARKAPTLEETKRYLIEKILAHTGATLNRGTSSCSYRYDAVSFEGNTFKVRLTVQTDNSGYYATGPREVYQGTVRNAETHNVSFSLSDLSPKNVEVKRMWKGRHFGVTVRSYRGEQKIYTQGSISWQLHTSPRRPQEHFRTIQKEANVTDSADCFVFVLPDEDIANRIARALRYAIQLSSSVPDPFQGGDEKSTR